MKIIIRSNSKIVKYHQGPKLIAQKIPACLRKKGCVQNDKTHWVACWYQISREDQTKLINPQAFVESCVEAAEIPG